MKLAEGTHSSSPLPLQTHRHNSKLDLWPNVGLKVTLDLTSKHGPACWSDVLCSTGKGQRSRGTGPNSRSSGAPTGFCQANSHVTKHHLHGLQREHGGSLRRSSESTGDTWMGMSQVLCLDTRRVSRGVIPDAVSSAPNYHILKSVLKNAFYTPVNQTQYFLSILHFYIKQKCLHL